MEGCWFGAIDFVVVATMLTLVGYGDAVALETGSFTITLF